MASIKVVDPSALGEGVIDSWVAGSDFGGFVFHNTGRIVCASPRRWMRSKVITNRDL